MFRRWSFPLFSPPPAYDSPDPEEPFVVPLGRRSGFRRKSYSPRKNRRFANRKRSRRKHPRRRSPVALRPDPRPNSTNFFPEVFDPPFMVRNPNQYIVYLYPVFIRPRKRRVDPLKKRRFFNTRRQYWTNLRNKIKRSAGNATAEVSLVENERNKSRDVPRTSVDAPPPLEAPPSKSAETESDKYVDSRREPAGSFRYNEFEKYRRDYFDLNPYLDMTQPPVTLPTVTFKYPYDRHVYESPLRRDLKFHWGVPREESSKRQTESGPRRDIGKLKEMLQEVESMLGSERDAGKVEEEGKGEDEGREKQGRRKEETTEESSRVNETISLKEKIDCIAIPILTQISERLGKMTNSTSSTCNASMAEAYKTKAKANYRCSPDGTWKSSALGTEFTFTTLPNMMLKVKIPSDSKAVINRKWSIQGLTLSNRGGPLMLAAIYPQKRKIASFIGQCKTCRDQDLIFGSWTVYSCARKFTDLWGAVETKMDILKKVKVEPKNSPKKSQKRVNKSVSKGT